MADADADLPPNRHVVLTDDARKLVLLRNGAISEVSLSRGGRSVAFRVTLEDGSRALFKPEQSFAAHWFSEVASYHLDRALGLGRVPAATGRSLAWETLKHTAKDSKHVDEVRISAEGTVRGAMIWWLSGKLVPLSPPPGWEAWLLVEPSTSVSPFQRRSDYERALKERSSSPNSERTSAPAPKRPDRAAELSDMVLFDYLTANHDRWGGNFTNVRTLGEDGPLVLIDNANGFPPRPASNPHLDAQLRFVQRFRRRTVRAIQTLELDRFRAALAGDPLGPLLTEVQLAAFEARRDRLLEHVDQMREKFGTRAFPW